MDENILIVSLHKFTGCSIDECHKALNLAMKYLKFRHTIGDHPEEASKHEYELVPKDYISKSEQWLKELTEYKQIDKHEVPTIPISAKTTNGDMIKALFPQIQITNEDSKIINFYVEDDTGTLFIGCIMRDLWNEPYKAEIEE